MDVAIIMQATSGMRGRDTTDKAFDDTTRRADTMCTEPKHRESPERREHKSGTARSTIQSSAFGTRKMSSTWGDEDTESRVDQAQGASLRQSTYGEGKMAATDNQVPGANTVGICDHPFLHLIHMLTAQKHVIHTYAAHCTEKLLLLKLPDGTASFKTNDIQELTQPLLHNLFDVFNFPGSMENEYVMKEYIRYVFQVLQVLLEFHEAAVPSPYMALFQCLWAPLWERQYSFTSWTFASINYWNPLLGIFQKLISMKSYDQEGLIFFYPYAISKLIQICDQIQPKLFGMVIEQLFILGSSEGFWIVGSSGDQLIKGDYAHHWVPLLQALIDLLELPEDESLSDDEHFIEIEDTPELPNDLQLNSARKKDLDPCVQISNLHVHLTQSLSKVSAANLGRIHYANLAPNSLTFLLKYMEAANVSLA
ncbi:hypothetical protein CHUAL_009501 [Chamberlinius hualienensis]